MNHEEQAPGVEERCETSIRMPQVQAQAARPGIHGGQFRQRECAEHRQDAPDDPRQQDRGKGGELRSDRAGDEVDRRSNRRADGDRYTIEERELAAELRRRRRAIGVGCTRRAIHERGQKVLRSDV